MPYLIWLIHLWASLPNDPFAKIPANFNPNDDADPFSLFFTVMATIVIILSIIAVGWVYWKVNRESETT